MPNIDINDPITFWVLMTLVVWDGGWKGVALWKASKNHQRGWFVALFLLNSAGILPIVYLKFFQKQMGE